MKKMFFLLLIATLALPGFAKGKKDDSKPDYLLVDPETAKIFPKVEEPLTLQRGLQDDVFFVKEGKLTPAILSFKVLNRNNLEVISLDEWFQEERNNIRISIAPLKRRGEKLEDLAWKQIWPAGKKEKNPKRQPVALAPGNYLMLDVPAEILLTEPLKKVERRLAVKVELNLRSAKADPLVFEVRLRKKQGRVKELIFAD
ncbi:MAG: hypothetical protein J6C30_03515 [Lentisphaeria bacterium]|nr:hypothetical protein [Lentisphaeria bacterium]